MRWSKARRIRRSGARTGLSRFPHQARFQPPGRHDARPVGIINERHEPPAYNGVERPFVETSSSPPLGASSGFGFTGDSATASATAPTLHPRSMPAASTPPPASPAAARRFDASFRNPAKVARLEYTGLRRLTLGASFYTGHAGFRTPGVNPRVTIAEFDGRYSFRRLDFRGLFVTPGSAARAAQPARQLESGINPNVASRCEAITWSRPLRAATTVAQRPDPVRPVRKVQHPTPDARRLHAAAPVRPHSWVTGITYKPTLTWPSSSITRQPQCQLVRKQSMESISGLDGGSNEKICVFVAVRLRVCAGTCPRGKRTVLS